MSNKPSLATQAAPQVRQTAQARRWRTMSWLGMGVGIFLLIYYGTIFVFPFGTAIWLSFHNWDFIVEPKFIGLRNYQRMFLSLIHI